MQTDNKDYFSPPHHVAEEEGGGEEEEEEEEEGYGPVYGEEEDLRRAIEMSLAEHHERTGDGKHSPLHVATLHLSHLSCSADCGGFTCDGQFQPTVPGLKLLGSHPSPQHPTPQRAPTRTKTLIAVRR